MREVEARSWSRARTALEPGPYGHLDNAVHVGWREHGRPGFLWDRGHSFASARGIASPDGCVAAAGTATQVCVGPAGEPTPMPPDLRKILDS